MAGLTLPIEYPTRLCVVKGEVGYFHLWERYSRFLKSGVYGIVEFKDSVRRVDPIDIKFRDDTTDVLNYIDHHEDAKKRIVEGKSKYSQQLEE